MKQKLRNVQGTSLLLLTTGIMLCNLPSATTTVNVSNSANTMDYSPAPTSSSPSSSWSGLDAGTITGLLATLAIAASSGFASVYTEKVIKAQRPPLDLAVLSSLTPNTSGQNNVSEMLPLTSTPTTTGAVTTSTSTPNIGTIEYGLAYTQVQLALMSLVTIGVYAMVQDFRTIVDYGLFYQFTPGACFFVITSAVGGLIVAAALKYADSILKNYATAFSATFTGLFSVLLFGTQLSAIYVLGMINVLVAIFLYNSKTLDNNMC
jgi:solute carrier family 35 (UDP-sugar transporter), member A1/2/3